MLARDAPHDETLVESCTSGHRFRSGLMCSDLDRVVSGLRSLAQRSADFAQPLSMIA